MLISEFVRAGVSIELIVSIGAARLLIEDIHAFIADPEGVTAGGFGVSIADLWAFNAAVDEQRVYEPRVRCGARTKRGRQCRCYVAPYVAWGTPASYAIAMVRGGYCAQHGDREQHA